MPFVRAAVWAVMVAIVVAACGAKPAPDFRGRWKEVNAIDAEPRPIPLRPVHTFRVLPSDRTLKDVVGRWANESRRRLAYRAPLNYSVHLDAAKVTAPSLDAALSQLESAYAAQAIRLSVQGEAIVVAGGVAPVGSAASSTARSAAGAPGGR